MEIEAKTPETAFSKMWPSTKKTPGPQNGYDVNKKTNIMNFMKVEMAAWLYSLSSFHEFFEQKSPKCIFLNVRICSLSLSFITINNKSLGFGLFFGQKKQFEDVTLGSAGISMSVFFANLGRLIYKILIN